MGGGTIDTPTILGVLVGSGIISLIMSWVVFERLEDSLLKQQQDLDKRFSNYAKKVETDLIKSSHENLLDYLNLERSYPDTRVRLVKKSKSTKKSS